MKGKRYTTEEKIRILRQADGGKKITDVCREHNVSEVTFHRWKKQFGQMEVNEAKRLKELERENSELKKMLAESLLKNRVLEAVCEKSGRTGASPPCCPAGGGLRTMLGTCGVPDSASVAFDVAVSPPRGDTSGGAVTKEGGGTLPAAPAIRVSKDCRTAATRRLAGGKAPGAAAEASLWPARATDSA